MDGLEVLGALFIGMFILIAILLVIAFIAFLVNGYNMMRLLQACGYPHSWIAWLPLSGNPSNVLSQCELFCEGNAVYPKFVWIVFVAGLFLNILASGLASVGGSMDSTGVIVFGWLVALVAGILQLGLWVFAIISITKLCERVGRSSLAPILCFIFVPWFGVSITCTLIRHGMEAGKEVM